MGSRHTCVCNVGQVVVLGAPGELLQFSVGQVEGSARRSFLQRLLHATTGRYCGRQLGSIPSSHQRTGLPSLILCLKLLLHFHTPQVSLNSKVRTPHVNLFKSTEQIREKRALDVRRVPSLTQRELSVPPLKQSGRSCQSRWKLHQVSKCRNTFTGRL